MAHEGLDAERRVQLHFPHAQWGEPQLGFVIRTAGDPAAIVSSVRAAIREVDRDQPIADVFTMDTLMDRAVGQRRLLMTLLATFAALAMVLAALGIYGVMAFDVTRRSRGDRRAHGARRGASERARPGVEAGARDGGGGRGAGTSLRAGADAAKLQAQLFGVTSTDPSTFVAVALGLLAVATLAIARAGAARRRVNPVEALRYE